MLEMIVSEGNPRIYFNKDLSLVELTTDKIIIQHNEFYDAILYTRFKTYK